MTAKQVAQELFAQMFHDDRTWEILRVMKDGWMNGYGSGDPNFWVEVANEIDREAEVPTASFNYWMNDKFEVIKLRDGEVKEFSIGGETEEGWSYTDYKFTHEGDVIQLETNTRAKDCDGRMDDTKVFICPLDQLAGYETPDGTLTPNWERLESYQRDYSAEAMGY